MDCGWPGELFMGDARGDGYALARCGKASFVRDHLSPALAGLDALATESGACDCADPTPCERNDARKDQHDAYPACEHRDSSRSGITHDPWIAGQQLERDHMQRQHHR